MHDSCNQNPLLFILAVFLHSEQATRLWPFRLSYVYNKCEFTDQALPGSSMASSWIVGFLLPRILLLTNPVPTTGTGGANVFRELPRSPLSSPSKNLAL
eukprot:6428067-Amphidinium_carterae.1